MKICNTIKKCVLILEFGTKPILMDYNKTLNLILALNLLKNLGI